MARTYDWTEIQDAYDKGASYRDLKNMFGVHSKSLQSAKSRGDFIPRDKSMAAKKWQRSSESPSSVIAKWDWKNIQDLYDNGQSIRDIQRTTKITNYAFSKAVSIGLFKTRSQKDAYNVAVMNGWKPGSMSEEARQRMSVRQSENYKGGFCKWFEVHGQRVQGTWERDAGYKLTELGIEWRKCGGKKDIISYEIDGKTRSYTPDFYLPSCNVYLEFKGYWWYDDMQKMHEVMKQNPHKTIVILQANDYKSLLSLEYTICK